ncbi:MAG: tetratricopeptide repeat protein [Terriglobia bacterium]
MEKEKKRFYEAASWEVVRDANGNVTGIWVPQPDCSTYPTLAFLQLVMKRGGWLMTQGLSTDQISALSQSKGCCRIVPTTAAGHSGAYLMFGESLAPSERPLRSPSPTSYVESVFAFDLAETSESRDWQDLDELKDVPDLFHHKQISQVEAMLNAALTKFPDYSFVFSWQGTILEEKGEIERARQAYTEGIRVSKEKHGLCGNLAMLEFEHGTLKEAVRWWIRSILLQMESKSVADAQSFLYLAFVALLNQQNDASSKLMDASSKGMHGTIALSSKGKQNVSQKVNAEPYDEIRSAIQELTTRRWTGF